MMISDQIVLARGSIYGARDAGTGWYEHLHGALRQEGFPELWLDRVACVFYEGDVHRAVMHIQVETLLDLETSCQCFAAIMPKLETELHLNIQELPSPAAGGKQRCAATNSSCPKRSQP